MFLLWVVMSCGLVSRRRSFGETWSQALEMDSMFLRNSDTCVQVHKALQPARPVSTSPWFEHLSQWGWTLLTARPVSSKNHNWRPTDRKKNTKFSAAANSSQNYLYFWEILQKLNLQNTTYCKLPSRSTGLKPLTQTVLDAKNKKICPSLVQAPKGRGV
jgi:hypothetical protein